MLKSRIDRIQREVNEISEGEECFIHLGKGYGLVKSKDHNCTIFEIESNVTNVPGFIGKQLTYFKTDPNLKPSSVHQTMARILLASEGYIKYEGVEYD